MKKPLARLLTLRQSLKSAAAAELNLTESAMRHTETYLGEHGVGRTATWVSAQSLQDTAYIRELAVGHLIGLKAQAQEQREELARTKREERQVELLVQKRAEQAAKKSLRQEAIQLDDWFRATTWEKK